MGIKGEKKNKRMGDEKKKQRTVGESVLLIVLVGVLVLEIPETVGVMVCVRVGDAEGVGDRVGETEGVELVVSEGVSEPVTVLEKLRDVEPESLPVAALVGVPLGVLLAVPDTCTPEGVAVAVGYQRSAGCGCGFPAAMRLPSMQEHCTDRFRHPASSATRPQEVQGVACQARQVIGFAGGREQSAPL